MLADYLSDLVTKISFLSNLVYCLFGSSAKPAQRMGISGLYFYFNKIVKHSNLGRRLNHFTSLTNLKKSSIMPIREDSDR